MVSELGVSARVWPVLEQQGGSTMPSLFGWGDPELLNGLDVGSALTSEDGCSGEDLA
jgi:hypothetical protein